MSDDVTTSATIASLRSQVEALSENLEACYKAKAKLIDERDERNAYAERLLAEYVQLTNRQMMDLEEIESMAKRNDELRAALDTARERAGVLEAEVRAWREACDTWQAQTQPLLESLSAAVAETDRTHALDAAKFGGGSNG